MPVRVKRQSRLSYAFRTRIDATQRAKREGAKVAASVAKQLAPEDTGELKSKIALLYGSNGGVKLVSGAEHSMYVEFGTINMAAQPFFRPGVEAGRAEMRRIMKRARGRR